jgi:hypothetical protein
VLSDDDVIVDLDITCVCKIRMSHILISMKDMITTYEIFYSSTKIHVENASGKLASKYLILKPGNVFDLSLKPHFVTQSSPIFFGVSIGFVIRSDRLLD